jgi:hypothetical protein
MLEPTIRAFAETLHIDCVNLDERNAYEEQKIIQTILENPNLGIN